MNIWRLGPFYSGREVSNVGIKLWILSVKFQSFHMFRCFINVFFTDFLSVIIFVMPRFYRRRGYSRTYRRSRWPYRSWRRSSVTRSSQQGRRRFICSIPCSDVFTMTVNGPSSATGTNYWSDLHAVSPYCWRNSPTAAIRKLSHGSLLSSPLYRTYTGLYDQVKVDSCYVKISIMTNVGNGGLTPAIRIVTSWDRDATYDELDDESSYPTINDIQNGSESQVSMVVNNSRAIVSRYCRASDLQERSIYHDCSCKENSGGAFVDEVYAADGNVGFSPALFIAINSGTSPAYGASFAFTVQVDVKWVVTFRNPKYGLSSEAGTRTISDIKAEALEEVKAVDELKDEEVLPDVDSGAKKFDSLSAEEKAKIMELIGSMEDEKGAT